ncbi:glycogen synthase [Rhizosphaericola mali]|uniref:Glycogen synthase n=1 Tax=Rhizosphaericola mali TaxID=2545455 RepID=A0A5P2G4J5_9BACT|nr:glycogen synthase [Rhizosphaericola mali]QES88013.1 glycogen synthase [Rhizosphaericola mali]
MKIVHVTAECYPVAKVGGLGDVAGALPKYQNLAGEDAKLIMPMYKTPFLYNHEWENAYQGNASIGNHAFEFTVIKEKHNSLGFDLYLLDINGVLDREKVYGYSDDTYRFLSFQIAVVHWLSHWEDKPDVIHCHDYHTGMISFMMKHCYAYQNLSNIPSILTIHNAQYQGQFGWNQVDWIPAFDPTVGGLIEWKNDINPLATAIKNSWKVNTVSDGYLHELIYNSNGLEDLFEYEKGKCSGILNGIDDQLWNPNTDNYISHHYNVQNYKAGKEKNKEAICKQFGIDGSKPLFAFIGRLVGEKAADLLPDAILSSLYLLKGRISFIILGSGEKETENQLRSINSLFPSFYHADIGYNEALSHQLYASADFLLMPSRVEPCGLNQMYSMRYGTIPIVRRTGGLKDTVKDVGDGGWGICFNNATSEEIIYSIGRAMEISHNPKIMDKMIEAGMQIDHSWNKTVTQYLDLYRSCF